MTLTTLITSLRADPRRVFVLDGVGALVSAVILGLVLPPFDEALGTTRSALHALAALPVAFALYDLVCWAARVRWWRAAVRGIATANLLYPVFSAVTLWNDQVPLTGLGIAYFTAESATLWAIAALEYRVAAAEAPE
jgi:hypothetical protein